MDESVVSGAAERIESLLGGGFIKPYFFDVVSVATAISVELKGAAELLVEVQQMKELAENVQVGFLSTKLRRIAFDAEDVVDTYVSETKSSSTLIRGLGTMSLAYHTCKELRSLRKQMQVVKTELKDKCSEGYTEQEVKTEDSQKGMKVGEPQPKGCQSSNGHCKPREQFVVGIQKDVERLVTMLTVPAKGDAFTEEVRLDVLAIVGMGGSGKTTLARNIYNHPKVKKHFYYLAWVSFSHGWTTSEVLSEICRQLQNKAESSTFWHRSKTNKCLLVLDNVWNCETLQEELLSKLFQCDYNDYPQLKDLITETKIVIASQHNHQPENTSLKWFSYEVQLLNEDDGWELFNKVFKNTHNGVELEEQYHDSAKEVLRNCQGLASAIVELGRLFKIKDSNHGWGVLRSQFTRKSPKHLYLPESNDILALSYQHLPYYLKPCFLYFGLFPKDSIIAAGRLMRMWIAEGFVRCRQEETPEEAASRILQELIDHMIVQVEEKTYAEKPKTLRVHNLITDLCIKEAQKMDFLYSSESSDQTAQNIFRRAAINLSNGFTLPCQNSHLRSILLYGQGVDQQASIGNQKVELNLALVLNNKLLRVLDISGIKTTDGVMPKDIGNLVHLRYLRIRSTNITKIPDTIGNLRKLITFVYRNVVVNNDGIRLPDVLYKLTDLRHLYLPSEKSNRTENLTLHTLKNLRTLWGVKGGKWMLKEMPKLTPNLTKLCIQGIADKRIVDSLFSSPIIKTQNCLRSLTLEWYGFSLDGLEPLCSKKSLLKLKLKGNIPDKSKPLEFPCNLQKIELFSTQLEKPESMEALGKLPYLKFLRLAVDSYVGSEWIIEDENTFPQLKVLEISSLPNLEKWKVKNGSMPCLKSLSGDSRPFLGLIPDQLKSKLKNSQPEATSSQVDNQPYRGFGVTTILSIIHGQ